MITEKEILPKCHIFCQNACRGFMLSQEYFVFNQHNFNNNNKNSNNNNIVLYSDIITYADSCHKSCGHRETFFSVSCE